MTAREMKNAIQMGHFGNLAAIAASIPDGDKTSRVIGYVTGKAKGVSYRANPNGSEPSVGLNGIFEATPVQEGLPVMVAPTIFLPTSFCMMVAGVLMGNQKPPKSAPPKGKPINVDGVAEVPLVLEIGLRKNAGSSGVGYEFSVTEMIDNGGQADDALAELREFLPAQIAKQSAPALPAPKSKSKSKKK